MLEELTSKKLPRSFYSRDVLQVATELLNKFLVKTIGTNLLIGKIVEVEAYKGASDQAAHTYNGKTERNKIMFGPAGFLYVYFTYGMHYCCNVVTGNPGEGDAVLIRGIEPVEGLEKMAQNRFGKINLTALQKKNLTNGPAKICKAFGIARQDNGTDLLGSKIFIADLMPGENKVIHSSTRIGIKKSVNLPWRYFIKDNPHVSN